MTTFQTHKNRTTSEKLVLAWLEPSQRLFSAWINYDTGAWLRVTNYYVAGVRQDGVMLTQVSTFAALTTAGQWFFDPGTMSLCVMPYGGSDPAIVWTDVTYRLFFSNAPVDLPATLVEGDYEVPYDARLKSASKFKESFSDQQKGIALEGSGSISLHNNDAYFEPIYDKLIWENKACTVFSWARDVPLNEMVVLFNGVVTEKDFDPETVKFSLKNFIYKLRSEIDLPLFSDDDGILPKSLIGKPKRRIYGRVDGLSCSPVANMQSNYELQTISADLRTGTPITVSLSSGSNAATASSTDVHKDLCAGDAIELSGNKFTVKSLARIDIGLDSSVDITFSRTSSSLCRIAFSGIVTSSVTVGDHITISVLNNAATTTKAVAIGHFIIATVNASYLEFTWSPTVAAMATDTFKSAAGEIAVTRHSNTTAFTVQKNSAVTVSAVDCTVTPAVPYRRFNRLYSLAHHALSTKTTTVVGVTSAVKFSLDDVDGFYVGDLIRLNSDTLSTITGMNREAKLITVADVVLPFPSLGTLVERLGIQTVTHAQQDFTQFTDFNPVYDSSLGARLKFDPLAEFNAADTQQTVSQTLWYSGSKQVLGFNNVFAGLKVRDWISNDTDGVWYEISEKFSDNLVILNTTFAGTTGLATTSYKQPSYLSDNSVVIANVYGKTVDGTEAGELIVTGAEVVKDLMTDAGVGALINSASFDAASEECPYRISLAIPTAQGGNSPLIRNAVNYISDSVVGSLFNGIDGTIQYRCLDASRPFSDAIILDQGDMIDSSVSTDSSIIYRKVLVRFAPRDADTVTEKPTYSVEQSESSFVINSGIDGTVETVQTYLYDRDNAQILAQRLRYMHELAGSRATVVTGLLLADASLNDLVTVNLDRIYTRLGTSGNDRSKTGLISSISRDGLTCTAVIDDLGNIFNRTAAITPNDAGDFTSANETDRRFNGYITDNDGLQTGDETTFNANLIG